MCMEPSNNLAPTERPLTALAVINGSRVGALIPGADLIGASPLVADLVLARVLRGNLRGADLHGARGLTQEQLNAACGTAPKGLDKLNPPLTFHDKPCPGGIDDQRVGPVVWRPRIRLEPDSGRATCLLRLAQRVPIFPLPPCRASAPSGGCRVMSPSRSREACT